MKLGGRRTNHSARNRYFHICDGIPKRNVTRWNDRGGITKMELRLIDEAGEVLTLTELSLYYKYVL